jgi:hypothetical protein
MTELATIVFIPLEAIDTGLSLFAVKLPRSGKKDKGIHGKIRSISAGDIAGV